MSELCGGVRYDPIAVSAESTVVSEYLPLTSEAQLIANLRTQLEALNGITFSDAEWERFCSEKIAGANEGAVEKTVRIQEDHVQILKRDDGSTKNVALIDKTNIHNKITHFFS